MIQKEHHFYIHFTNLLFYLFLLITLATADWHYMRKFSLTSSQAHSAFIAAFSEFKDEEAWISVAEYLYSTEWRATLLPDEESTSSDDENASGADEREDEGVATLSTNSPLADFLNKRPIPDEDDQIGRLALDWAKRYVNPSGPEDTGNEEDDDCEILPGEAATTEVRNTMSKPVSTAVCALLPLQIQNQAHRKKCTPKELIEWLQMPNSRRKYLFYKGAGLREILKARKIKAATGGARKVEDLINTLVAYDKGERGVAGDNSEENSNLPPPSILSPKDAAVKEVLMKSFQKPHGAGKHREYCSLGHRLELPILKKWIKLVTDRTNTAGSLVPGLSVEGAYNVGLAAKKGALYAKDSVDFVLPVKENGQWKVWGFEAKGRVTVATAAEEERWNLRTRASPHIRIEDVEVSDEIARVGERFQILQHAFVYNFPTVVFAVSDDQSHLIRSLIIDFSPQLKEKFGKVLEDLKKITLEWAYPTLSPNRNYVLRPQVLPIPDDVLKIAELIPFINGVETMQGTANLWFTMSQHPKPLPSFSRLIPSIYAYWNAVKGGSDTTSKLMDDCILRIPKSHMNTETVAITRLLFLLLVTMHRLGQIFTANEDLETYVSLQAYRKAASQRRTFYKSLLAYSKIIEEIIDAEKENNRHTPGPARKRVRRTSIAERVTRSNMVDGVMPTQTEFGHVLNGYSITPKKINKLATKFDSSHEIAQMVHDCTGMVMKAHPANNQQRCNWCNQHKTTYYCAGCKRWLCFERRCTESNKKELKLYSHRVKGNKIHFQKQCYHLAHEEAWKRLNKK